MDSYSISFTLGKASDPHGANLDHNRRTFTAANVEEGRSAQNIEYKSQDIWDAYAQLFGQAITEYNARQKKPCRRIQDYYLHIRDGKREEPFYEIVVQFGDMQTASCGSPRGEMARQMLDEYMRDFQRRNPNLYVFNAVLHLDEASPHLHIDFIPFYTKARERGLSKGVSMKAALIEQGFAPKGIKHNQLVLWEEAERTEMERVLHRHGFVREDKQAHYAHMTVGEFKRNRDLSKAVAIVSHAGAFESDSDAVRVARQLRETVQLLEHKTATLEEERRSPYKAFFYSSKEKQAWIISQLEQLDIPFRETENGLEAPECHVLRIRQLEKEYRAPRSTQRDKVREDVDRALMQSRSFDELLTRLEEEGYTVKQGKYVAVKPKGGGAFIRLKSLGEHYTENALKNRLETNNAFHQNLMTNLEDAKKKNLPNLPVLRVVRLYTATFKTRPLPMRRVNKNKPVIWANDTEMDILIKLNRMLYHGATLDSMRNDMAEKEKTAAEKAETLDGLQAQLGRFRRLKECLEVLYDGKADSAYSLERAREIVREFPDITSENWKRIDILLDNQESEVQKASSEAEQAQRELRDSAKMVTALEQVLSGSFVQDRIQEERTRRYADIIPNGVVPGTGAMK